MGDISLVDGWFPIVVLVLGPLLLVLAVGWTTGVWKRQLVIGVAVAAVVTLLLYAVNSLFHVIPYAFPFFFYVLGGLVGLAVVIAVVGWKRDRVWQRVVSIVAVFAMLGVVGVMVNNHYRYRPTMGALFGKVAENELDTGDLDGIRDQVRATGQLPKTGYTIQTPIPSTTDFQPRDAYVYLPPAYFADPSPDLPVIEMLAGVPGSPSDWLQAGNLDKVANDFAAQNQGRTPLLVMPDLSATENNDTECTDTDNRGLSESYLVNDVPEFMRYRFHAATGANSLGVAGFSVGGFCAVMLPVRHPDVFSAFGDYSGFDKPTLDPPEDALGDLFRGDQAKMDEYDTTKLIPGKRFENVSGWFETGSEDPDPLQPTKDVAKLATDAGMTTCLLIRPGGHDFDFWEKAFRNSLPWLSWRLHAAEQPPPVPGAQCSYP